MFNTLVKKDEKFDYVGELASDIKRSDDGLTFTFTLRDGVKFHDGRAFSSADAKYTLDLVFSSDFAKSASFSKEPAARNELHQERRSARSKHGGRDVDQTLGWSVIEPGSDCDHSERQLRIAERPSAGHWPIQVCSLRQLATGLRSRGVSRVLGRRAEVAAVRVRVISDMNALQAELQSGRVDIAPLPTSLSPDAVKRLEQDPNLQVKAFPGSNVVAVDAEHRSAPRSTM